MPASGISIATSSGVSMLSWSELRSMAQILSNQWIQKRRPHWDRLSTLLAQCGAAGLGQLSRAELRETGPALPPGSRRPLRAAAGLHRPHLCRARKSVAGSRPPYHLFRPQDHSAHAIPFHARRISGYLPAADRLRAGLGRDFGGLGHAGRGAHQRASGVHAALCRAGDDRHHGATRDVDQVDCGSRAHGVEPDHDQQPHGQLCHLCYRHYILAWVPFSIWLSMG